MACDGPDLDLAKRKGEAYARELLSQLKAKIGFDEGMFDYPKVNGQTIGISLRLHEQWKASEAAFITATVDMMAIDAAMAF